MPFGFWSQHAPDDGLHIPEVVSGHGEGCDSLAAPDPSAGKEKSASADDSKEEKALEAFAACAVWSLGLSVIIAWLLNVPIRNQQRLMRAIMKRAGAFDAIEQTTTAALDAEVTVMVTLKNKKVYVGVALTVSPLETDRKWFALIPIMSGYRDESSKLDLTVFYDEAYDTLHQKLAVDAEALIQEFRIIVAVAEIVSIQVFDIETYMEHFKKPELASAIEWKVDIYRTEAGWRATATSEAPEETQAPQPSLVLPSVQSPADEPAEREWDQAILVRAAQSGDALTPGELWRLRYYYLAVGGLSLAILVMPYHYGWSAALAIVALVMAFASVQNDLEVSWERS
jgi:hypothetical protein